MEVKGKYKLLMVRAKYLKNALQITKDIFQKAYVSFMSEFNEKLNSTKRPSSKVKKEQKQKDNKEQGISTEKNVEDNQENVKPAEKQKDENLRLAFKRIAKEIHPDKLSGLPEFEREYKETLFNKARMALEENDYYAIVEVSEELGLEPPEPNQEQIEIIKKSNSVLEVEIKKMEESLIWAWYHSDEDKKKNLMEKYIGYLEKQGIRS
tara:strand:- start:7247 stop:7870 length:624 start_codon:yes stop_codon:yes gene_type:complete